MDNLPERLDHTDDLGKTVLEGQARTVRGVPGLINFWLGSPGLRRRADARRIQGSDGLENLLVHLCHEVDIISVRTVYDTATAFVMHGSRDTPTHAPHST